MIRLLLVCHGATDWNAERRYQGHADRPLSHHGLEQARLLRDCLAGEAWQTACSSDLKRACETARTVAGPRAGELRLDSRLRELDFGAWDGLTFDEVQREFPTELAAWHSDPVRVAPPGGETLKCLASRLQSWLHEREEGTALVVGHRGAFRVLLCLIAGLPVTEHWQFDLPLGSLSVAELDDAGARLLAVGDVHHLREANHAR